MFTTFMKALVVFLLVQVEMATASSVRQEALVANVTSASKAGLAWPNGNWNNYKQYTTTGKVSWYYTWSPDAISAPDLEFVPMLWGPTQVQAFTSSINDTLKHNKVTAVLGFNEPQEPQQSNLTVEQGAQLWMSYIEPLKAQGLRLGTPAPSGNPNGVTWLQGWLEACNGGCNPDFLAVHWYDVNATAFQEYLINYHNIFNLPIWVTEWACQNFNGGPQCTQQEVIDLLNQTQAFMDSTDWVERYAWFGVMENLGGVNPDDAMMSSTGSITTLGQQYINANSTGDLPSVVVNSGGRLSASVLMLSLLLLTLLTSFL